MEKQVIKAVHENNLEELLKRLGMLEDLKNGKLHCSKCNKIITTNNLLCLYPVGENINVSCNAQGCYESVLREKA
jgi:hypothetical protein